MQSTENVEKSNFWFFIVLIHNPVFYKNLLPTYYVHFNLIPYFRDRRSYLIAYMSFCFIHQKTDVKNKK